MVLGVFRSRIVSALLAASFLAASSNAAHANALRIDHSGSDLIGKQLAYELAQQVERSADFVPASEGDEAWKVVLLTVETDGSTSFSVSLVKTAPDALFDYFVTAFVGVCGAQRVQACSSDIMSQIAVPIADYEQNWSELADAERTETPSTERSERHAIAADTPDR
ncbi:MAG: hypothetical protein AAF559_09190 [Pseudomonadota bacterium]